MNKSEFLEIMEEGFELENLENQNTELNCFECGEPIYIKRSMWSSRLECDNGHRYDYLQYTIEHINSRDGLLKKKLALNCCFPQLTK